VIGALSLDHTQRGFYGSQYEPILAALATQISNAVNNARLYTALRESERYNQAMLEALPDMVFRYNRAGDYRAFISGGIDWLLPRDQILGKNVREVVEPELALTLLDRIAVTLDTGSMEAFEYQQILHGEPHIFEARMVVCGVDEVLSVVRDVTDRKRAEASLKRTMDELTRSNEELQQFAYVASHDLQEPLRMIASYVQLISKRYHGKLDSDADEFIAYAVDGAHRMQALINGLLAYSRVGTLAKPFVAIDCEEVLQQALDNLQLAIADAHAEITHDPLPSIQGDPVQLIALFQNLISNAIKFRGSEPPHVHIMAGRYNLGWLFSVRDNGIGIASQYAERIFVIFKRLHTAAEYPGTGIGLAICKKIVERHSGRIWVESAPGQGATFYFYIPVKG
jgi:signal transduction histidine kinase